MFTLNSPARTLLALISLTLFAAIGLAGSIPGQAKADYLVMLCAGGNSASRDGFKSFNSSTNGSYRQTTNCNSTDAYPDGSSSYLRTETSGSGKVNNALAGFSWTAPKDTYYLKMSAYTREEDMSAGWRHQVYGKKGSATKVFTTICPGCATTENSAPATRIYAQRSAWWDSSKRTPFDTIGVRLACVSSAGCERSPATRADSNSFVFTAGDSALPAVAVAESPFINGAAVRGIQNVVLSGNDAGSGVAFSRLLLDGRPVLNSALNPGCQVLKRGPITYGKNMKPCPGSLAQTTLAFDTTKFADGAHSLAACIVDFSGNSGCKVYNVFWQNNPPPAPMILERPNNPTTNQRPIFTIRYNKAYRLICKVDARPWTKCTSPYRPGKLGIGKHTVKVAQVDATGRAGDAAEFTWVIKPWTPFQCTLQKYQVRLTPKGIFVTQAGKRQRLVRYHLYRMNGRIDNGKTSIASWRRPVFKKRTTTALLGRGGFLRGRTVPYLRNQNRVKMVVSVINETRRCNVYNLKTRTKILVFNDRIKRGLGLNGG